MRPIGYKNCLQRRSLGALVVAAIALGLGVFTGSCFSTKTFLCADVRCDSGQACATKQKQPVCVDIGSCGDGHLDDGEICEDNNLDDDDGCDANCMPTGCGNGVRGPGEQCDDGNERNGDGCDKDCTISACGNGIWTPDTREGCDGSDLPLEFPPNVPSDATCSTACRLEWCGDGVLSRYRKEECDDGNKEDGDGCLNNCMLPRCDDGVIYMGYEDCDHGSMNNGENSVCPSCKDAKCGDGYLCIGMDCPTQEMCDEGEANSNTGTCLKSCQNATCGDGYVREKPFPGQPPQSIEVCDDASRGCGTCSDNCKVFALGKSTGSITVIDADMISTNTSGTPGKTFALDDGLGHVVFFEFVRSNQPAAGRKPIDIVNMGNVGVRNAVVNAINAANITNNLQIYAFVDGFPSTVGAMLRLEHRKATKLGDVLVGGASDAGMTFLGMTGGAGGDCADGTACRLNEDCRSKRCLPDKTCGCSSDADCYAPETCNANACN